MNAEVAEYFHAADEPERWNDWRWQYTNRITDAETLAEIFHVSEEEKAGITRCLGKFRMAISPYYAALIDSSNPDDPIRRQCVPSPEELDVCPFERADPLREDEYSPVPNLIHRYPDRVLFLVTRCCAMYCRHCTRRRIVGEEDRAISRAEIDRAVEYIAGNPKVRDVLVSGGDPLTLSDERLEYILSSLRRIEHVEIIRIGSRVPVTLPMRVTDELTAMLKKYHPLWLNTHFNHPNELTPASSAALARLADAGIPLGNQSVLLKGVNDDAETMRQLVLKLLKNRVRPYYLYQCDLGEGLAHFKTDIRVGLDIIDSLQGRVTGFAIPRYVIDAPGGGGKIPINTQYAVSEDAEKYVFRNYEGRLFEYPKF